jgi:putative transposase
MPKRQYRTQAEWSLLIDEQEQSGLCVLDFCRQHRLLAKTFYRQRKALGRSPARGKTTAADRSFIQVAVPRSPSPVSGVQLHYRSSQLYLPSDTDPLWIAKLLQALS